MVLRAGLCHPGEPVAADVGDLPCFGHKAIPLLAAGPAASRARGAGCTGARVLEPGQAAVPHHYMFSSGWLGDRLLTNSDSSPGQFGPVARQLTSRSAVHVVQPGQLLMLRTAAEDPVAGGRPGYGETVHDGA